jgi:putative SOS response-associated peptidase YedK
MRWGLVPFFTKQLSDVKGISTINARAESVAKSPTWLNLAEGIAQKK